MATCKRTLLIGASTNPDRYAYIAAHRLTAAGHPIVNIGIKKGAVAGVPIEPPGVIYPDIDTITLYIGPHLQPLYYDYILKTHPKRIIFNPGTENEVLRELALAEGIESVEACTLVLLATKQF